MSNISGPERGDRFSKGSMFHSNPKAGVEITDLLNCHKRQPLGTERTAISEKKMSKTMKIKIYLPGGKHLFIHQNPEEELQMMDLR